MVGAANAGRAFLHSLATTLPGLKLLTEESDRQSFRRDETPHYEPGLPLAIALPSSTEEVAAIMRLATEHRVPVVPRGAGSGLSGGAAGIDGALTVVVTRMNRILEIDLENRVAVVQPGVVNADLKASAASHGLHYAPDPASFEFCTIGGNIASNAGGLCCVKYGVTREAVLGLEVVLADGRVIRTGGRNLKDVAGYSLTHLMIGSQGTLGIITEATMRLRPAPSARKTLLAFFATLDAVADALGRMALANIEPCTLELMDRACVAAVDDWRRLGLDRSAAAMLLIESDEPAGAAEDELRTAEECCAAAGATGCHRASNELEAEWLREVRRLAFPSIERMGNVRMEDVGVPRSRLADLLGAITSLAESHDLRCGIFGHAGDGNLHPTFVWDRSDDEGEWRANEASEELYRVAVKLGGTVSGEHGIGAVRRDILELQIGADALAVMHSIKCALDPLSLLNPDRSV